MMEIRAMRLLFLMILTCLLSEIDLILEQELGIKKKHSLFI